MNDVLLSVQELWVSYGNIKAIHGISFDVHEGEIVTLIGANGAGKSSTLRAISGLIPYTGKILYKGQELRKISADKIVGMGIAQVPEGRGIFGNLTVLENLKLATWQRKDKPEIARDFERVFGIFPRLQERRNQLGGTLSGGEQQMLAVARALMSRGKMVLLDEPSMGLAPVLVREIFRIIGEINQSGTTVLLVEQNANMALRAANRGYVLETGNITLSGTGAELLGNPRVKEAYLGG
ncbi:MAG TPA: ABC transporter ATP-binding protein [Anaerolineaceae bacterium]|jgi:branched-chain amino acid transport system ATP-binding protein|nr:ABC transporter ATP-binding protein [Anaerolineaceae bacterium]NMD31670.1 ABC transporter ATP-binding protein [Chloroflexota bacterium]HNZ01103.1 ABC transporter ATP-binding protein [Anaerolineaceae bacterium]HOD44488.1 ABC transporter ATP-binding protein [Anaerolineaceae bacterium]HOH20372.1 ABC transporter ATP-binding protein [Anaerolineaceae bacterium]